MAAMGNSQLQQPLHCKTRDCPGVCTLQVHGLNVNLSRLFWPLPCR